MKRRTKIWFRSLAVILAVVMALVSLPLNVFAEEIVGEALGIACENVFEIEEARSATTKTFRLEDGSYYLAQYDTDVHYLDENGEWKDIDNTLYQSGSEIMTSPAKIRFKKATGGSGELFSLYNGNSKLSLSLDGANKKISAEMKNNDSENDENATTLEKMTTLNKISSSVTYRDILDGVDIEYVIKGSDIKENIIVKEKSDSYSYSFTMSLNNLVVDNDEDGSIILTNINGERVYTIPVPVMWDSAGTVSNDVSMELLDNGNGKYTLNITADSEWMNDTKRSYPITIDPPIYSGSSGVTDLEINTANSSYNASSNDNIGVSATYRAYWKLNALPTIPEYAYITDATFTMSCYINEYTNGLVGVYNVLSNWDSTLTAAKTPNQGRKATSYTDLQLITTFYSDGSMSSMDSSYEWNVTPIVKSWYSGSNNYGLCFAPVDEDEFEGKAFFSSSEHLLLSARPTLCISYRDMNGLEDYWTFTSQSAGFAGSGYINNSTGNLVFSIPTLSTTDSLMPITPTLVYNSSVGYGFDPSNDITNEAYEGDPFGYGFHLNICETIIQKTYKSTMSGNDIAYYVWYDGDGTSHAFMPRNENSTEYIDEDGLKMKLSASSYGYTITDDNDNVRNFTKIGNIGYLSGIADQSGNSVQISFNSDNLPSEIILTPNQSGYEIVQLTFSYNSAGRLTSVNNPTAGESVNFTYSNGYLSQIQYVSGGSTVATATYTYASSGALSSATNGLTNYSLNYSYNSAGKVSGVEEKASGTLGQKITLSYSTSSTVVRTSGSDDIYGNDDDLLTTYVFDSSGRTVSNYTTDINYFELYGASSGEYVPNDEEYENAKNSLKSSSVTTLNAPNLLLNGGFEKGIESWTKTGNVVVSSVIYNDTNFDAVLTVGNGISTSSISQEVTLRSGDYTLSVLLDSENDTGASAYIKIESLTYSRAPIIKEVSLDRFNASESAILESVEFSTLMHPTESPEETERFKVTILLSGNPSSSVSLRVDEVMLIKGKGAASYDMVQMGHFETTGGNIGSYWKSGTGAALTNTSVDYKGFSRNVLMIQGEAATAYNDMDTVSKAVQVVYQLTDSEKAYFDMYGMPSNIEPIALKLSGWAKGSAQAYGIDSQFSIMIEIKYYQNGNVSNPHIEHIKFDRGITDWQFGAVSLVTKPELGVIESITITIDYVNNPGVAYFDDITLTKEGASVYDYTDGGYLETLQSGDVTLWYKYDDDDNLIQSASSNKSIVQYYYDSCNRVITEVHMRYSGVYYPSSHSVDGSLFGLYYVNYTYDSYGLVTNTCIREDLGDNVAATQREINTSTTYITGNSHIFGAVNTETDEFGEVTRYFYDQNNGRLLAVLYPEGNGLTYNYDAMGNITNVFNAKLNESTGSYNTGWDAEIYYGYNSVTKRLDSIYTGSVEYGFTYDVFGNTTQISADNYTLASYTYNSRNGKLSTLTYGNGLTVKYLYDTLDRVEEIQYNIGTGNAFETVYSYEYEASGRLHSVTDHRNDEVTLYRYDASGKLLQTLVYDSETYLNKSSGVVFYNNESKPYYMSNAFDVVANGLTSSVKLEYGFGYNERGMLSSLSFADDSMSAQVDQGYDNFGRPTYRSLDVTLSGISSGYYNYVERGYTNTSQGESSQVNLLISTVGTHASNTTTTYNYTYDDNGNITQITDANGVIQYKYYYDTLDRLVREDNRPLGKSYTWTYDFTSNITSKKTYAFTTGTLGSIQSTDSYGYASLWADRLTSYNGVTISYDNIGNPSQLVLEPGMPPVILSWEGRELKSYNDEANCNYYSYTYNADGIRTSKNVNGSTHEYYLDGSRIIGEYVSTGYLYMYMYDETGSPIGIKFRRGDYAENTYDYFFFEKNLQGDIVAIYNENGTKIGSYTYDAWGNVTVTTHTSGIEATIARNNPFRYRGYYYDLETGWYYLQSRYYNPEWGRFINADGYVSTGTGIIGYNMFAYCDNNPVAYIDPIGSYPLQAAFEFFWNWLTGDGGESQHYEEDSRIVKKLKKSKKMRQIVDSAIENYKVGQPVTSGESEFTSADGKELYLSTQQFSYTVTVEEQTRTKGWWIFKREQIRYVATVTVEDTYNFDSFREGTGVGTIMNNIAYLYHLLGGGHDYEWSATYTYSTKWKKIK